MLLALNLMFVAPVIMSYLFAARAQARATRAGENSGALGMAMRLWAYQQVVPPVALLAMFFWVTVFVMVDGGGPRTFTPQAPPAKSAPPPGYEWGPNDSLRRIGRAAPTGWRRPSGTPKRKAKGPATDPGAEGTSARPRESPWSEPSPALPPDDGWTDRAFALPLESLAVRPAALPSSPPPPQEK